MTDTIEITPIEFNAPLDHILLMDDAMGRFLRSHSEAELNTAKAEVVNSYAGDFNGGYITDMDDFTRFVKKHTRASEIFDRLNKVEDLLDSANTSEEIYKARMFAYSTLPITRELVETGINANTSGRAGASA